MPKVSVVVPVYNVEDYVERSLNSLVNQTLDDIEIIVVNDGSTDSSKEKILKIAEKSDKIKYLEKENGGLSDARNFGMKYATGDYICFLDSDDYVDETIYEKMYNKAIKENADYVECDFIWEYPDKKKIDTGYRYKDKREMFVYARVVAWNKLIKRDIIKNEFPKGLHYEDVEFFYKLLPDIKKFSFVEEPLIHYIQRENSIANKQDYKTAQIFNVLDNTIDYYKKNNLYDDWKEEIEYTYARLLLCSSLKRMCHVDDDVARERLLGETWVNLNTKFPDWKKNKYLKVKSLKNKYMKSVNKFTYKIYCKLLKK